MGKLEEIEKTTGQPKSLLAGGGALFGLFLVFFLCPPQLVFSAVGVGYPTYASLLMLAEDTTEDAAMWITYWCLFTPAAAPGPGARRGGRLRTRGRRRPRTDLAPSGT